MKNTNSLAKYCALVNGHTKLFGYEVPETKNSENKMQVHKIQ